MSVLIYLDVCCLNRPFDDQTQERVRLESEAVLLILGRCQRGEWQLMGSEALAEPLLWRVALEINQTRDSQRKSQLQAFADLATLQVTVDESIEVRAGVFIQQGLGTFDALHLACAEASQSTALLTTDDRLVRWAGRQSDMLQVKVANPVRWLLEVMTDANP
ncbi:MAG TPA: PIN domain-containing protein [Chroococcidiopsis sp.]